MADKMPQAADDDTAETTKRSQQRSSRPRTRKKLAIPGVDDILRQLMELNGAVLIGTISAKQAEMLHKNLRTVLQVQLKRATRDDAGPASQEGLVELCRHDPKMLHAIEPFLTDEQVQRLMNEVTDDPDNEAV